MFLLTWLADILAGGKQRRLKRAVRRVQRAFEAHRRELGDSLTRARLYGRTLRLAMRIQPAEAQRLSDSYDEDIADTDYAQAFPEAERDWLERHSRAAERHGLAVCLQVAGRLRERALSKRAAFTLAELLARQGDADRLILHLDTCRQRELLSASLLDACLTLYVGEHSLGRDRETWLRLFAGIPADDLPDLFEVHALLGRSIDAARLAQTPAQRREAVDLCLSAHYLDGATPGIALADELGDPGLSARLHEHIGDLHAAADDDQQALVFYDKAGATSALSRCHERLGNLWDALHLCPEREHTRLCELVDQCQPAVHEAVERGEFQVALEHIATLCTALAHIDTQPGDNPSGETDQSSDSSDNAETLGAIRRRLDDLHANRQAVCATARKDFIVRLEQLDEPSPTARRQVLLDWSRLEETAGNLREAGQRAEQADALYLAHRLYRAGENFGDAIRVLSRMQQGAEDVSPPGGETRGQGDDGSGTKSNAPADIARDIAQALKDGGDFAGAATAFRDLGAYRDAQLCYARAGDFAAAAECARARMNEERPEESAGWPEWVELMTRAKLWDSLLSTCLQAARRQTESAQTVGRARVSAGASVLATLRSLLGGPAAEGARLTTVSEARAFLESLQTGNRGEFERRVPAWIKRARKAVNERYSSTWGLDLGTTNCAVAIYDKRAKEPILCPWKGAQQFPSTLGIDADGREVVGLTQEQLLSPSYPASVYASKRHMGKKKRFALGSRKYRPEEVAARLIAHARTMVEDFLSDRVMDQVRDLAVAALGDVPGEWLERAVAEHGARLTRTSAVVTIPAFFRNNQKHGTRDACAIAGVDVKRLLHEPTAACLAANRIRALGARVVVVDLGAGTLDLSAVEVDDKIQEVIQISGDTRYGGRDYDAAIYKLLKRRLSADHGLDVSADTTLRKRLELAAECLKIDLSLSEEASYTLHGVGSAETGQGAGNITLTLSRTELSDILDGSLKRLDQVCRKFLAALPWQPSDLVLVGGPVLSPLIRQHVERALGRKATAISDPRLLVAQGAALQAAVLDGAIQHVLLLDVVPLPLGIQVVDDSSDRNPVFSELIPANTTIPVVREERYSTVDDNQPVVAIRIFQGELSDDSKLGEFRLENIPPAKAGEPQIDVRFDINADCVLTVTAQERKPGQKAGQKKSVTIHDTTLLAPDERARMTERFARQQSWQSARADLRAALADLAETVRSAESSDLRAAAQAFRNRLDARRFPMNPSDPDAQATLFAMFNTGAEVEAQAQVVQSRVDDLRAQIAEFSARARSDCTGGAATPKADADHLQSLQQAAVGYHNKLRDLLEDARPIRAKLASWSALLTRLATHVAEPLPRFIACHEVGDTDGALRAFAEIDAEAITASLARRHLDCLAADNQLEGYRNAFQTHRQRLGRVPLDLARLERFVERISPSIGWIQGRTSTGQRFAGSGFLIGERLLATNRHVVADSVGTSADSSRRDGPSPSGHQPAAPVAPEAIEVHLAGDRRAIKAVHLPARRGVDVALLELAQPCSSQPLPLGYSRLTRVGQQVVAIGFPWSDPDRPFEENFEVQAGVINKFETVGESAVRYFKVGIRIGPGMSGGPVFNDLGEVIGIVTLGKLAPLFTQRGAAHYVQSSYALAVEPLRTMVPAPWSDSDGQIPQA